MPPSDPTAPRINISSLDHLVLTVGDVEATCAFYARALNLGAVTFGGNRRALVFGSQKINLHPASSPLKPHAARPTPGSADLCFVTTTRLEAVIAHLVSANVAILEGPVRRTGTLGPITSVYFRDPDLNLIEVARYDDETGVAPEGKAT